MEEELTCEHFKSGTQQRDNTCSKPEHNNKKVKICIKCRKVQGRCLVKGCGEEQSFKVSEPEFYQFNNVLFKAGFLSLRSQKLFQSDQKVKGEFLSKNMANLISLEDWKNQSDNYVEKQQISDKRNVTTFQQISEYLIIESEEDRDVRIKESKEEVKEEEKEQKIFRRPNIFSQADYIPLYFSSAKVNNNSFLITGGAFPQYSEEGEFIDYAISNETYELKIININHDLYLESSVVESNEQNSSVLMNQCRIGHQSEVINDQVYVLGGNYYEQYHGSIEKFDAKNKKWVELAGMQNARSRFTSIVDYDVENNKIYLYAIGGYGSYEQNSLVKKVERYDVIENKWETLKIKGLLNVLGQGFGFRHPEFKKMFIVGGIVQGKNSDGIYLVEDDKKGGIRYNKIGALKYARANPKVCITQNKDKQDQPTYQIVVYGGLNGENRNVMEYFYIREKEEKYEVYDHKQEDFFVMFEEKNEEPALYDSSCLITVNGFQLK